MAAHGEIEIRQEELLAEGARLGEEFGLGPCATARAAKRRPAQFGCGASMLAVAAGVGLPGLFIEGGVARIVIAVVGGVMAIAGLVMIVGWQDVTWDRLFVYGGGLAQIVRGEPEPLVVRWEDVVTVSLSFGMDDDSWDTSSCTISGETSGRTGTSVTVDSAYGLGVVSELAREAERVLAARLVPGLIQAYESGEPVIFGEMTIDRQGITGAGGSEGCGG